MVAIGVFQSWKPARSPAHLSQNAVFMREERYLFGFRALGLHYRCALVLCAVCILEIDVQPTRCALHQAQEAFLRAEDPESQLSLEAERPNYTDNPQKLQSPFNCVTAALGWFLRRLPKLDQCNSSAQHFVIAKR
jgi:hypothetical protein